MKLTLGQVRGTLGLSQETYRHWRTVLLPLAVRKGHGACFSHGDLLALAIVKSLTDDIGIPVGGLDTVARALFDHCGQQPWTKFERLAAWVHLGESKVTFVPEGQLPPVAQPAIVVPCAPIISALRATLMLEQAEDAQGQFKFPLAAVTNERGGRASS